MTRPSVEVRRAEVKDVDDLLQLWACAREEASGASRAFALMGPEHLRSRLCEALGAGETSLIIARWDGRPAGYAVLHIAPLMPVLEGTAVHVDHLFVTPDLRKRGIAKALLSAVTSVAERHGAEQVLTSAPPSARETHRFLARLGFSPLAVRRVATTSALRRRLSGETRRKGLEDLLSRRRTLRARNRISHDGAEPATLEPARTDTLEMPVVVDESA